jgi:autotransporter-associated beta strand protein
LTKLGAGTLTLTKDHTYTGSTTISAGDLQVGTGGSVSQASSGTINSTSAVTVASGSKLILAPNENVTFAAPISGAGGVEIKGMSGAYYNSFLTSTATTMVSNSSVLEVLTRITGGLQDGANVASGATRAAGAYVKSYNASANTATLQFQQYDGVYTKCVFAALSQSGANVQIRGNTSIYSGAAYRTGNHLGADMSSGSTLMGLATSAPAGGYGISNVYMSGKVNFTGSLTYSGTTTLSNTVTSVTSPNTYSYTSRGTQEITDASTSFPSASTIVNNGLVIFNRNTALTVSNDMSGTEEVLQVGADITMTGANTYTGNTTLDLNKTLNIGSGSTTGSMTGNIINYGTLSFNRSDSSSYTGVISGTGAVIKNGNGATTLTGLNTYIGATTINAGRLVLQRDVPATSSSGYSGAGILVVQPNSNSFTSAVTYPIPGFTVSSGIGGLTIGKPTNTANITVSSATTAAGPITLYGGAITVSSALTAAGNILLDADVGSFLTQNSKGVTISAAVTTTNNGNITILARGGSGSGYSENHGIQCTQTIEAGGTGNISITAYGGLSSNGTASSCHGINMDGSSAWIKSNGGNVAITGFGGGAGSGTYSQGFAMLNSSKVSAAGTGIISIAGTGGVNSVIGLRGIVLVSGSSVNSAGGAINLTGNNGTNGSDNSDGITLDNATVGSSTSGAITLTGYAGGGIGSEAISLSSSSTIGGTTHAGNILIKGNAFSIASAASILTTGQLTIEPTSSSFTSALTYPITNLSVAGTITGLTLGKSTNTADITVSSAQTISGPISIYGGAVAINGALTTTNNSVIIQANNRLTQTAAITAAKLGLLGSGNAILENIANNIGTLAAGTPTARVGGLKLVNNNSLIVGTVNPTGIYSSGEVMIVTRDGDNVNINAPINTTSTSGNAVRIYADIGKAAGTSSGGQVIVNGGTITMGTGGIAKLFSGNESASYGLNDITGGSNFLRYNVATDSSIANGGFSPVISSTGVYAIYRDNAFSLTNLTVGAGTLSPTFSSSVYNYTVTQSTAPASFTFTPTVSAGGTIYISQDNGISYTAHTSGTGFVDNVIDNVSNKYIIQVRDASGTTAKTTYTLHLLVNQTSIPTAVTTDWRDLFKAANFDPNDDQQATAETDLVGNATYAMMQSQQRTISVSGTVHKVYYFRVRLGNTGTPKTSAYFGLDVNKDLKIDMVVEANLKAATPYVSYHKSDPSKDGSSPSTTSWLNSTTNTAIEQRLTAANSEITNYAVVTTVTDLDNASITGNTGQNTGTDTWLEFAFTESSFAAFTLNALGSQKTGTDVNGIVYFTSTSQTANGDIGGINDKTANLTQTWSQLGIILTSSLNSATSAELDPPTVRVQSTSSLNGSGTIYGAWNGNIYTSPSLTVTIGGNTYYYNVAGQTNSITIDPSGLTWSLIVTGYSAGTYNINAVIADGTGTTGTGNGTLLISELLVQDSITFDTTPKITGTSSVGSGTTVNVKVYDPANMSTPVNTGSTTTSVGGSWNYTVPSALPVKDYTVIVDLTSGSSTATDTGLLRILDYVYPTIRINSGSLTHSGNVATITGTSNHHLYSGTKSMTITMSGPGGPHSGAVTIGTDGSWSISFNTLQAGSTYTVDANLAFGSGLEANDFGTFNTPTPLPVSLLYLNGVCVNDMVVLNWATAMEDQLEVFEVQQSNGNGNWKTLATVKAAGFSHEPLHYAIELKGSAKSYFYRLKCVDFGGPFTLSKVVSVVCPLGIESEPRLYPNPSEGRFTLETNAPGTYVVFDAQGRQVINGEVQNQIEINLKLPGIYFVQVINESGVFTERAVVK